MIIDIAGVQKLPNANPAATITSASSQGLPGHGRIRVTRADANSAARSGGIRPKWSDARPRIGAHALSIPAMTRYVPPTAAAPQPSSESRSGPSTERLPNSQAGSRQSHIGTWIRRSRSARNNMPTG